MICCRLSFFSTGCKLSDYPDDDYKQYDDDDDYEHDDDDDDDDDNNNNNYVPRHQDCTVQYFTLLGRVFWRDLLSHLTLRR
jgi:hypothetical protein